MKRIPSTRVKVTADLVDIIRRLMDGTSLSRAYITARYRAVVISDLDGEKIVITPNLARKMAPQLIKMADLAETLSPIDEEPVENSLPPASSYRVPPIQ